MFRFTIRDVFWLIVVVAVSVGWSIEHVQLTKLRRLRSMSLRDAEAIIEALERLGMTVEVSTHSVRIRDAKGREENVTTWPYSEP